MRKLMNYLIYGFWVVYGFISAKRGNMEMTIFCSAMCISFMISMKKINILTKKQKVKTIVPKIP